LAIFLLGILVWRTPVTGYTAGTTISAYFTAEADASGQAATIASAENVRRAVRAAADDRAMDDEDIEQARSRLTVNAFAGAAENETRITVIYTGDTEQSAVAVVNQLAKRFITAQNKRQQAVDETRRQRVGNAVEQARQQVYAERQKFDAFLNEHFEHPTETVDVGGDGRGEDVKTPAAETPPINPDWQELTEQLARAEDRRELLLSSRMPLHPEVRATNIEIKTLTAQLNQTPKHLPDERASADARQGHPTAPGLKKPQSDETLRTYRELIASYDAALQRRQAAAADQKAWQDRWLNEPTAPSSRFRVAIAGHVIESHGGATPPGRVALLALLAIVGGGVLAWGVGAAQRKIASLAELEEHMPLPIVGAISTNDGPELKPPRTSLAAFSKTATLVSELTLVAVILLLVFSAVFDFPT